MFITIVPKERKEVKQFLKHLRKKDVQWKDAFEIESSRKKGKINIYKTYEPERTRDGFRIIFVHSSSKQEDDEKRRQKKIDKTIVQLEELAPKLNAYHLKTKKEIKAAIEGICRSVKGFIAVKIITERKQIKVKVSPGRPSLAKSVYKNKWEFTHSIQWELNQQALLEASKTDGIFP